MIVILKIKGWTKPIEISKELYELGTPIMYDFSQLCPFCNCDDLCSDVRFYPTKEMLNALPVYEHK